MSQKSSRELLLNETENIQNRYGKPMEHMVPLLWVMEGEDLNCYFCGKNLHMILAWYCKWPRRIMCNDCKPNHTKVFKTVKGKEGPESHHVDMRVFFIDTKGPPPEQRKR